MKFISHLIILLGLFSSCDIQPYTYRKPVVGLIYDKEPLKDVSVVYESSDVLSPQNIKTNEKGRFVLPKIEMRDYEDFKNSVKGITSIVIIKKVGYKPKTIDIKKYNTTKDTINVGIVHLEKTN